MASIETGNSRMASNGKHRRAVELLGLAGASLALLFTLAVAFGFVSG